MWFLIQLLIFVCSLGSIIFTVYVDRKSGGALRVVARTTLGRNSVIIAKIIGFLFLIVLFGRLGWYPLAASVFLSMTSLLWAWTAPKSS